jgi:hypothetical protein
MFATMRKPLPETATVLIGERLHSFYDDIVQQELPSEITAAIERLAAGLAARRDGAVAHSDTADKEE